MVTNRASGNGYSELRSSGNLSLSLFIFVALLPAAAVMVTALVNAVKNGKCSSVRRPSPRHPECSNDNDGDDEDAQEASRKGPRVTYKRLCRAAGGRFPGELRFCVESGWTASDIDRYTSGKSALHMAAWTGCLENLKYLIETIGCDPNAHSIANGSYGKTAIFFAATRCRADVVEYLLDACPDLKVNIVNNKGQSVISICVSHEIPDAILDRIRRRSAREESLGGGSHSWQNFRASHSDGMEYGDLDPRFLGREPRDGDVLTPDSVNPTTRESRRGAFARRNPGAVAKERGPGKGKGRSRRAGRERPGSTEEALRAIGQHESWDRISGPGAEIDGGDASSLADLVEFADRLKCAWIPFVADKLVVEFGGSGERAARFVGQSILAVAAEATADDVGDACGKRSIKLLEKVLARVSGTGTKGEEDNNGNDSTGSPTSATGSPSKREIGNKRFMPSLLPWKEELQTKTWRAMEMASFVKETTTTAGRRSERLVLPQSPVFVNALDQFLDMRAAMRTRSILSIDTEWYDDERGGVGISTLQVSAIARGDAPNDNRDDPVISTYVVDLMDCREYRSHAQAWIRCMLESEDILVLGFAINNDVSHLERFCGSCSGSREDSKPLRHRSILDLQKVLCSSGSGKGSVSSMPGLKTCVSRFTDVPLSKAEQCSEWARRPLTEAQLEYAGMDAAILLVMLAEHLRARGGVDGWTQRP